VAGGIRERRKGDKVKRRIGDKEKGGWSRAPKAFKVNT